MRNLFVFGYAGSGKTTVREMLEELGYDGFALADPIKHELERWLGRKPTKHDRALMIEFGQTFRRWFGDDVWCRRTTSDLDFAHARYSNRAVIEDGRHVVEYDFFVGGRGFTPVRIVAPDEVRFDRLVARDGVDQREVLAGRENELDLAYAEYEIVNDGTMDELEAKVNEMIDYFARCDEAGKR